MTKIYLVKVSYLNEINNYYEMDIAAFTNFKKAKIYCEYKNLQLKLGISIWKDEKEVEYTIETMNISQSDWSQQLNELQIKNLPY